MALLVSWLLLVPSLPIGVRHWLYTLGSATFLGAVFDAMGELTRLATGILAAPAFDKPWLVGVCRDRSHPHDSGAAVRPTWNPNRALVFRRGHASRESTAITQVQ